MRKSAIQAVGRNRRHASRQVLGACCLGLLAATGSPWTSQAHPAAPGATFTVDSVVDEPDADVGDNLCRSTPSGGCTLRAAIQQANALAGDDLITFSATTPTIYLLTRPGDDDTALNGDLDITGKLSLTGNDAGNTVIDGNHTLTNDRVFHVLAGAVVTLSNVTIQNGYHPSFGGGIYNRGTLTVAQSTLSRNSSGNGGAIGSTGTLTVTTSRLADNTANNRGGGIFDEAGGKTVIQGSSVAGNSAVYGGGIFSVTRGSVTLKGGGVTANRAKTDGGGIYINGATTLSVTGTLIDGNFVGSGTGTDGSGGGIYHNGTGILALHDSTVAGNIAGTGAGIFSRGAVALSHSAVINGQSRGRGGGIFSDFGSTLRLTQGSSIGNNTAASYGAGLYNNGRTTLTDSTVKDNTSAQDQGGGIFVYGGPLTLANSTVSGNKAGHQGGGIYNVNTITVTNSTLSGNSTGGDGGGLYSTNVALLMNSTVTGNIADSNNDGPETGGGIFNANGAILNLRNSLVARNLHLDVPGLSPLAVPDDCSGTLHSKGFNVVESLTGCTLLDTAADRTGRDPLLGLLADNGGPTWTHALLPGSPALDAGNPAGCKDGANVDLTTDQRGSLRPVGARCDAGAFEYGANAPTVTPTPTATARFTVPAPSPTGTMTPSPTRTPTPTATDNTSTPDPSRSPTPTPTVLVTPSRTETGQPTGTATGTAEPRYRIYLPVARKAR